MSIGTRLFCQENFYFAISGIRLKKEKFWVGPSRPLLARGAVRAFPILPARSDFPPTMGVRAMFGDLVDYYRTLFYYWLTNGSERGPI